MDIPLFRLLHSQLASPRPGGENRGMADLVHFSAWSLLRRAFGGAWPEQWRSPEPKDEYDAVIVGAGGHGLATAYYLAKNHKMTNIAVVEKGWLGGGNTGRNTTIIRSNYLQDTSIAIYELARSLYEGLSQD